MKIILSDLLICDMIVDPGIDGLETFKKILKRYPGKKCSRTWNRKIFIKAISFRKDRDNR
jgi:hypothetical protein